MFELYPKQEKLRDALHEVECVLYGGARGGAKSFASVFFCALDTPEHYTEAEADAAKIIKSEYRQGEDDDNNRYFYKFLIDYPYYQAALVRRGVSELEANTLTECMKIYPHFGGNYIDSKLKWRFPSGAEILLRQCKELKDAEWFQGQNLYRLHIEELTQYEEILVDMMETSIRAPSDQPIRAKLVYTANPGGRGHAWVYKKFVKPCPPVKDGERVHNKEVDYSYQPLKSGKDKVLKFGKTERKFRFIPSLVWDNPSLSEGDMTYVVNLMNKPDVLRRMWLDGDWSVKAGDFFDLWDENVHVIDVYDFFNANNAQELNYNRRHFDWSSYVLLMSYDYGFRSPGGWACGFYAISRENDNIIKVEDWLEPNLTSAGQAKFIKKEMRERYNIDITTNKIEYHIADPQNFWQRKEKGTALITFADEYAEEGILLMKGINDRKSGAKKMWEAHYWDKENPIPKLRFLSTAVNSIDVFPFLPRDKKDPEDVDTHSNDHNYDENRYMISVWTSSILEKKAQNHEIDWRDKLDQNMEEDDLISWRVS
jgi:hypothetical protein